MEISKNGVDFIKSWEKLKLTAYQDSANLWTVGYGCLLHEDGRQVKKGDVITEEQAERMLMKEIKEKTRVMNSLLKDVRLNQNQYDALCAFTFNVGSGGFKISSLLKRLKENPNNQGIVLYEDAHPNSKNWMEKNNLKSMNIIQHEFMKWVLVKGNITLGLQRRRDAEWKIYSGN